MKKIMVLSQDDVLINKLKPTPNIVLVYRNFMSVFEQLNFHSPDYIIFDFNSKDIDFSQSFMLESLPKKNESDYIKLIAIGASSDKTQMADFIFQIDDVGKLDINSF